MHRSHSLPLRATPAALAVLLTAVGCSAARPVSVSRPAPATALDCALRIAADSGFTPVGGGVSAGYVIFDRPHGYTGAEAGKEAAARFASLGMVGSGKANTDRMTVTGAGGALRLTLTSLKKNGKFIEATPALRGVAQYVLDTCAPNTPGAP